MPKEGRNILRDIFGMPKGGPVTRLFGGGKGITDTSVLREIIGGGRPAESVEEPEDLEPVSEGDSFPEE